MISCGGEISIAGGGEEMVHVISLGFFLFSLFLFLLFFFFIMGCLF